MKSFRPARMRRHRPPTKKVDEYAQLWRVIDGAVRDAMLTHPDYFPNRKRLALIRSSICKRVAGALIGFAEQSAEGGPGSRLGALKRECSCQKRAPDIGMGTGVASLVADEGRGDHHVPATNSAGAA